jgi:S-DNA-T family DNA segregation ATPase FtsK/SpoIIIE
MSPDAATPLRMQGVYVSDSEIHNIVRYWKDLQGELLPALPETDEAPAGDSQTAAPSAITGAPGLTSTPTEHATRTTPQVQTPLWETGPFAAEETPSGDDDELLEQAIQAVRDMKKASISLLQRRLRIGYTRSARLIDVLEEKGIIGPAESGAKPREVINYGSQPPAEESAPEDGEAKE